MVNAARCKIDYTGKKIVNEKQTKNSMSAWATLKSVFNLVEVAVVDNYLYVNILGIR